MLKPNQLILGACIAALLLIGSAPASARTVEISPAGRVTGQSSNREGTRNENIRFVEPFGIISISCNTTFGGNVVASASGELLRLEPVTNALIGQVTEGRSERCTGTSSATLLFGTGLWQMYKLSKSGERTTGYVLHAQILIEIPEARVACLIDALFTLIYNETNSVMQIGATRLLTETALRTERGFRCIPGSTFSGFIKIEPRLRVTLRDA
jgi:hypothetical protein